MKNKTIKTDEKKEVKETKEALKNIIKELKAENMNLIVRLKDSDNDIKKLNEICEHNDKHILKMESHYNDQTLLSERLLQNKDSEIKRIIKKYNILSGLLTGAILFNVIRWIYIACS